MSRPSSGDGVSTSPTRALMNTDANRSAVFSVHPNSRSSHGQKLSMTGDTFASPNNLPISITSATTRLPKWANLGGVVGQDGGGDVGVDVRARVPQFPSIPLSRRSVSGLCSAWPTPACPKCGTPPKGGVWLYSGVALFLLLRRDLARAAPRRGFAADQSAPADLHDRRAKPQRAQLVKEALRNRVPPAERGSNRRRRGRPSSSSSSGGARACCLRRLRRRCSPSGTAFATNCPRVRASTKGSGGRLGFRDFIFWGSVKGGVAPWMPLVVGFNQQLFLRLD